MPRPRSQGQPPLSRDEIVLAARELVARDGREHLSMRALAAHIGVKAPSLYHVIPHKQALVDALFDGLAEAQPPVPSGLGWEDHIWALGRRWRSLLTAEPGFALLALSRPPRSAPWLAEADATLAVLRGAGFSAAEAIYAYKSLSALVAGLVLNQGGPAPSASLDAAPLDPTALQQLPGEAHPTLQATLAEASGRDFDAWFDLMVGWLVEGLRGARRAS